MNTARIKVKLITGEVLVGDEISVEALAAEYMMSDEVAEAEVNRVLGIVSKVSALDTLQVFVGGVEYNLNPNHILYVVVERN